MTPEQLRRVIEGKQRQVLQREQQQVGDTQSSPASIPRDIIDQVISLDAAQQQSQAQAVAEQIKEMGSEVGSAESPRATRVRQSRSSSMDSDTKRLTIKSPLLSE